MKTKFNIIPFILIASFSFLQMECKEEPPVVPPVDPPYQQSIFLAVANSGLTDVYLTLSMTDTLPPRGFVVLRNNVQILSGTLFAKETTLVDSTALLNSSYTYKAFRVNGSVIIDSSIVSVNTLDTTSHDYTFTIDTLGDGSSQLNDVIIINDTAIYAVGLIQNRDSTGEWMNPPYSMVQWNGQKWSFNRLFYNNINSLSLTRGIISANDGNVYFGAGSIFKWIDKAEQTQIVFSRLVLPNPNATVEKLWSDKTKIIGVGLAGTIVQFEGSKWTQVQSGTTVSVNDVWGGKDAEGKEIIIAAASDLQLQGGNHLLRLLPGFTSEFLDWSPNRRINTVWFLNVRRMYVGGSGLFVGGPGKWTNLNLSNSFVRRIRGSAPNNIWAVGDFGFCAHYNGSTWRVFSDLQLQSGNYHGLAVSANQMIAVGQTGGKAVILWGKKNQKQYSLEEL